MSKFIKDRDKGKCSENEINSLLEKYSSDDSKLFCVYTTKFCCTEYRAIDDIAHTLEIRLFNESGEFKAVRANIGREFVWRYITDEGIPKDCIYDEYQYLDVDATKTNGTDYVSIGGGHYEMPEEGLVKVHIRHYGEYDDDGMFGLKDFRIVRFLKRGEK